MRSLKNEGKRKASNERGAILVLVGILLVVIISFTALAVDIGHLAVVRNELQNAADAGALAGASWLYLADGTVNPNANKIAFDTARLNTSDALIVDVDWAAASNGPEVQRGHWSFSQRKFTPHDSLDPVNIWQYTTEELDLMPEFINAVRVVARRSDQPAASFFAGILGFASFQSQAEAVAYLGFTGDLLPGEIDAPLSICQESIVDTAGNYTCNIGRLINSSSTQANANTGAWTNYSSGCSDQFNASDLASIIDYKKDDCDGSNETTIKLGEGLSVGGGQVEGGFDSFRKCGGFFTVKELEQDLSLVRRDQPLEMTVPVIDCSGTSNPSGCLIVVGAVKIKVVHVTATPPTGDYSDVPYKMGGWSSTQVDGYLRWRELVDEFLLEIDPNVPAYDSYFDKTIYAMRECEPYEPIGRTGGANYGVLAKIPALVQ